MQKLVIAFVIVLFVCGCAHKTLETNSVDIAKGVSLPLLNPATFGESVSLLQSAEIEFANEKHQLLFQVEITTERIIVVGLTPTGTRVFTASFDGTKFESDGVSQLVDAIDPRYLIADLQFSIWPQHILEQHFHRNLKCFKKNECRIDFNRHQKTRSLYFNDDLYVVVKYQSSNDYQSKLEFRHLLRGYQLLITPLSMEKI